MTDRRIKLSRKQEKDSAKFHNGRVQPGSGSGWVRPNDVQAERFLVENKRTDNERSITIKADDLRRVRVNATRRDLIGILEFYLGGQNYIILHRDDFRGYLDET